MYVRWELIKRATNFHQEADKNLTQAQKRFEMEYDRCVWLASIFWVGDYMLLDRLLFFRPVTKRFASEGYNKLFSRKQVPYKVSRVDQSTLRVNKDVLENTVSIHPAAPSRTSRWHCNDRRAAEAERPNKTRITLNNKSDEA